VQYGSPSTDTSYTGPCCSSRCDGSILAGEAFGDRPSPFDGDRVVPLSSVVAAQLAVVAAEAVCLVAELAMSPSALLDGEVLDLLLSALARRLGFRAVVLLAFVKRTVGPTVRLERATGALQVFTQTTRSLLGCS
jgi:hypothetical protein